MRQDLLYNQALRYHIHMEISEVDASRDEIKYTGLAFLPEDWDKLTFLVDPLKRHKVELHFIVITSIHLRTFKVDRDAFRWDRMQDPKKQGDSYVNIVSKAINKHRGLQGATSIVNSDAQKSI